MSKKRDLLKKVPGWGAYLVACIALALSWTFAGVLFALWLKAIESLRYAINRQLGTLIMGLVYIEIRVRLERKQR